MAVWKISEDVFYVGVNDTTLDLFESQYRIPDGVTYNSYVIKDSKIAVMDTVDNRATDAWFDNLEEAFGGKAPDPVESPGRCSCFAFRAGPCRKYPEISGKVSGNGCCGKCKNSSHAATVF